MRSFGDEAGAPAMRAPGWISRNLFDRTLQRAMALSVALALPLLLSVSAVAQSFEDGQTAASEGDPARAIAIWAPLAEAGQPQAQYALAESFWGGWWGVPENQERRAFWHMRAAERGHAPSFVQLGRMYEMGQHFAQDDRLAAEWFARAAEAGSAEGQYALGHFFIQGRAVPYDQSKAYNLWERAARQGHEGARLDLCANSGSLCNPCYVDPQTLEVRHPRGSDPLSLQHEQELANASWLMDHEIVVEGRTYAKSGLPQVRTAEVLGFFSFKDTVPFMTDIDEGPEPAVIYALYKGMECEVQPYYPADF